MKRLVLSSAAVIMAMAALAACAPQSAVVSENISTAADNFEINRRIVFLNGITDSNLLSVEGLCSITDQFNQLEVTCKVGPSSYKKHFLGLSDNVTYFAEQIDGVAASPYHYRVMFRPSTIIPAIELN